MHLGGVICLGAWRLSWTASQLLEVRAKLRASIHIRRRAFQQILHVLVRQLSHESCRCSQNQRSIGKHFAFGDDRARAEQATFADHRAIEMGAEQVLSRRDRGRYSIVPYHHTQHRRYRVRRQSEDQRVNKYLQSWDVSNVFLAGSSAFPKNVGRNPTGPVGALAYRLADTLKDQYLKRPDRLV